MADNSDFRYLVTRAIALPLRWGGLAGLIAGLTVAVSGAAWATAAVTPPAGEVSTDDGPALDGPGLDELVTPDAPGSVTVANVDGLGGGTDTGKVIVSWSAAGDNGSAITKYTVRYGVDPRVGCVTTALKCVVSGLTPGASLPFNVIASNGAGDGPASADVLATPLTKPRAPQDPSAVAGDQSAVVSWTSPTADGGSPTTRYEVRVLDGRGSRNMTGCWAEQGTSCTVAGLTNGVSYSFGIVAVNAMGKGEMVMTGSATPDAAQPATSDPSTTEEPAPTTPSTTTPETTTPLADDPTTTPATTTPSSVPSASVPSASVSSSADRMFVPLVPSRVLDTRGGGKVGNAIGTGAPVTLSLPGRGGLPADGIDAVALNVTVVDGENPTTGNGYVTVYPCGARPDASNLNFTTGQTIPNSVLAPVSAAGTVCFYVYGTAHLLADVSGYIPSGSQFTSLVPNRVLDTRTGAKVGNANGTGAPVTLSLFGRGGLPSGDVSAVALNVTVVDGENPTTGNGYVTVYPCGTRPDASNLNFTTGQTIPNSVLAPVSANGTVCFYVYGTAHLLADVSGYIPSGSQFTSLVPNRVLDTRGGAKVGNATGTGTPVTLSLPGRGGLPAGGIDAVALNVTVVDGENPATGAGYVTVYPCGTRPQTSNLNFSSRQTIPNSVLAPVSANGTVCFYVYGSAHLLADVSGYFSS